MLNRGFEEETEIMCTAGRALCMAHSKCSVNGNHDCIIATSPVLSASSSYVQQPGPSSSHIFTLEIPLTFTLTVADLSLRSHDLSSLGPGEVFIRLCQRFHVCAASCHRRSALCSGRREAMIFIFTNFQGTDIKFGDTQ